MSQKAILVTKPAGSRGVVSAVAKLNRKPLVEPSVEPVNQAMIAAMVKSGRIEGEVQTVNHPTEAYAKESGLPAKEPSKKKQSSPSKAKMAKPAKQKRIISQDVVIQALAGKKMEIGEADKACQKISPRKGSYVGLFRSEFKITTEGKGEEEKEFVHPEFSEHGAEIIAKFCVARGGSHYWLRKAPITVLAAGKKILNQSEYTKLQKIVEELKEEKEEAKKA